MSDNPFGMSFDELIQQINSGKAVPAVESPKAEPSGGAAVWTPGGGGDEHAPVEKKEPEAMNPPTNENSPSGVSFEALMAQAMANGSTPVPAEMATGVDTEKSVATPEPEDETASYIVDLEGSIDTSEDVEEPVAETPTSEEVTEEVPVAKESKEETSNPVSEEPIEETPVTKEPKEETSKPVSEELVSKEPTEKASEPTEETSKEPTEEVSEEVVNPSDAVVETVKEVLEKPAKPRRSRKKVTPPKEIEAAAEETGSITMEDLFTPDEVEQFRATLRSFVRKELKLAMTSALKELQKSFD